MSSGTIKAQRRGDELRGQDLEAVREVCLTEIMSELNPQRSFLYRSESRGGRRALRQKQQHKSGSSGTNSQDIQGELPPTASWTGSSLQFRASITLGCCKGPNKKHNSPESQVVNCEAPCKCNVFLQTVISVSLGELEVDQRNFWELNSACLLEVVDLCFRTSRE